MAELKNHLLETHVVHRQCYVIMLFNEREATCAHIHTQMKPPILSSL